MTKKQYPKVEDEVEEKKAEEDFIVERGDKSSKEKEEDEGLALLLGGFSSWDLLRSSSGWEEDKEVHDITSPIKTKNGKSIAHGEQDTGRKQNVEERHGLNKSKTIAADSTNMEEYDHLFERAFGPINPADGKTMKPPVKIVDMSAINNRGHGIIATRPIKRGEVIFTEKAFVAIQNPSINDDDASTNQLYRVRGCQQCFRSLEPASCLTNATSSSLSGKSICCSQQKQEKTSKSSEASSIDSPSSCNMESSIINKNNKMRPSVIKHKCKHGAVNNGPQNIPMPHLWPIQEWNNDDAENSEISSSASQRHRCEKCESIFCSKQCKAEYIERFGCCCAYRESIQTLLCTSSSLPSLCTDSTPDLTYMEPPVPLAMKMFCFSVQTYRTQQKSSNNNTPDNSNNERFPGENLVDMKVFHGLCGDSSDIARLELGDRIDRQEGEDITTTYSLARAYGAVCNALCLSNEEKETLSLDFFNKLAAIAARNGFIVTTKSPFKTYYEALLRATGGRSSVRHKESMSQLAMLLGSLDGKLSRYMDGQIEKKCAIQTSSLFTLLPKTNHSCNPCAEVRGHEFVDCIVDVVALRQIDVGEEITISYINVGKNAGKSATDRMRRVKELQARYLFFCDCERCKTMQ